MIKVLEVIPYDRFAEGVDIPRSLLRYAAEIAKLLDEAWIRGEGDSVVETDAIDLHVRCGNGTECWQVHAHITGDDQEDQTVEDGAILDEYRYAAAFVWARRRWAVMQQEEVRA